MKLADLPDNVRKILHDSRNFAQTNYTRESPPEGPVLLLTFKENNFTHHELSPTVLQLYKNQTANPGQLQQEATFAITALANIHSFDDPAEMDAIQHAIRSGTIKSVNELAGAELYLIIEHQAPTSTTRAYYPYLGDAFAEEPTALQHAPPHNDTLTKMRFFPD